MIKLFPLEHLVEKCGDRMVILAGAGKNAKTILNSYDLNFLFAVDNDITLNNTCFESNNNSLRVYKWEKLFEANDRKCVLLLTPYNVSSMIEQIENDSRFDEFDVYVYEYMKSLQWDLDRKRESYIHYNITDGDKIKIPKRIHYFWFSNDPYPEKVRQCIDSWKRYCPDYEITRWGLDNYETDNLYCREALSVRNWAFASDYGRCDVVYRYGGIYLDTDVELIKPLDDLLFDKGFFVFESSEGVDPGSGMASEKGNKILKEILERYEDVHYLNEDGSYNRINIKTQYTNVLIEHGLVPDGKYQRIEGIAIYPPLVLSPYSYNTGLTNIYDKTYGIHHWVSAWLTADERKEMDFKKKYIHDHIKDVEIV